MTERSWMVILNARNLEMLQSIEGGNADDRKGESDQSAGDDKHFI